MGDHFDRLNQVTLAIAIAENNLASIQTLRVFLSNGATRETIESQLSLIKRGLQVEWQVLLKIADSYIEPLEVIEQLKKILEES